MIPNLYYAYNVSITVEAIAPIPYTKKCSGVGCDFWFEWMRIYQNDPREPKYDGPPFVIKPVYHMAIDN